MEKLEILSIAEDGDIITTNGITSNNMTYPEMVDTTGRLNFKGDYQALNFYTLNQPIYILSIKLTAGVIFKNGIINTLSFGLDDEVIHEISQGNETNKSAAVKQKTIQLLDWLNNKFGKKAKGRKYFREYKNSFTDLAGPNEKLPIIKIGFAKDVNVK
jgi:hypothetical protein